MDEELRRIDSMESCYRWVAELVKPSELEENPGVTARAYMLAVRGMERCVELRLKVIREAGRLPEREEVEPLATVDLSRLSDDALEEVEAALVPVGAVPSEETGGVKSEEDGKEELCEKSTKRRSGAVRSSSVAVPKSRTKRSAACGRGSRKGPSSA
jgi:hypothetical protein